MLKRLISLVFLLMAFYYLPAFSDTTVLILPKIKPKNLSMPIKKKISNILPIKKPFIKEEKTSVKKAAIKFGTTPINDKVTFLKRTRNIVVIPAITTPKVNI